MTWHYTQGNPTETTKPKDWRSLPRPSTWKYSDPFDHVRHNAWLKMKSQAAFRGEGWQLTVEEFFDFWPEDKWLSRGRQKGHLCMTRLDAEKPWSKDNCHVVERRIAARSRNQDIAERKRTKNAHGKTL